LRLTLIGSQNVNARIKDLIPKDPEFDVRVEGIFPRSKDGGVFAKFSFIVPDSDPAAEKRALEKIEAETKAAYDKQKPTGWTRLTNLTGGGGVFLVKGVPWAEDMVSVPARSGGVARADPTYRHRRRTAPVSRTGRSESSSTGLNWARRRLMPSSARTAKSTTLSPSPPPTRALLATSPSSSPQPAQPQQPATLFTPPSSRPLTQAEHPHPRPHSVSCTPSPKITNTSRTSSPATPASQSRP
jgi:hypothetical protein